MQTGTHCTWYRDAAALYFPHSEMLYSLLYSLVSQLLSGNQPTFYAGSKSLVEFKSWASSLWVTAPGYFFLYTGCLWLFLLVYSQLWTKCPLKQSVQAVAILASVQQGGTLECTFITLKTTTLPEIYWKSLKYKCLYIPEPQHGPHGIR